MRAMIFAAGLGSRLRPLTDRIPKALVPVSGVPMLHRLLIKLHAAGCTHAVINVHHHAGQITDFIAARNYGMRIEISDESGMLLDTGGGLRRAAAFFPGNEPILLHNVDILSNLKLDTFAASMKPDSLAQVAVSDRPSSRQLLFDEGNRLAGWRNVQTGATRPADIDAATLATLHPYAFAGIHVVSPRIFGLMSGWPEKFSIMDFYLNVMQKEKIVAYRPDGLAILDVGKTDTLAAADDFTAKYGL